MQNPDSPARLRTGWASLLARLTVAVLLFETLTGLAVTLAPFHAAIEWAILLHTAAGVATLAPLAWYFAQHWLDYRSQALSDVVLLGYVGVVSVFVCSLSGAVVTGQALFGIRTSSLWRDVHLVSTLAMLASAVPHLVLSYVRRRKTGAARAARPAMVRSAAWSVAPLCLIGVLALAYSGTRYNNTFPKDYNFIYGKSRPFAPSLARTSTGGAFDARSLAGSESCGSAGCHTQILEEWKPSAHRYAAMDSIFQGIQNVMAKQNGPESTRYCGGCHDPISLFSGTKNIFVKDLTGLQGYHEGVSCLACHAIQKTDIRGNANYTAVQPKEYLWQWAKDGTPGAVARNFLIRSYPAQHNRLSKRMYKKPEYCAACHKQFIDQEVNRVGWVQLQNQYDNWAASHWNHKGDAKKTVECRECHMPLVASNDPAAGDTSDYNRSANDGKHRSHRFLAANNLIPTLMHLEGAEKHVRLTYEWLEGKIEIPEIRQKWAEGPVVKVRIEAPESVAPGTRFPIRVIMTSNKVGHDYPTGPLDMIQSWVELKVADEHGNILFASGRRDEKNFIEPGSFLFKAEPVDQYGNLIDRHNLWEMVGVRYRRSLFPGYSDTVEYQAACPSSVSRAHTNGRDSGGNEYTVSAGSRPGTLAVNAVLHYRKIDQFLLNYVLGANSGVTAPVADIATATATVAVRGR
ncbi:MAG: multiheme c-type cytochrome [Acidobacteriota bacterium]